MKTSRPWRRVALAAALLAGLSGSVVGFAGSAQALTTPPGGPKPCMDNTDAKGCWPDSGQIPTTWIADQYAMDASRSSSSVTWYTRNDGTWSTSGQASTLAKNLYFHHCDTHGAAGVACYD